MVWDLPPRYFGMYPCQHIASIPAACQEDAVITLHQPKCATVGRIVYRSISCRLRDDRTNANLPSHKSEAASFRLGAYRNSWFMLDPLDILQPKLVKTRDQHIFRKSECMSLMQRRGAELM